MGVYIKGMRMPKNCRECPVALSGKYCRITHTTLNLPKLPIRPNYCPIISLPDHHGRLVDADPLIEFIEDRYDITWESDCYEGGIKDACTDILEKIDTMPTIVEAEGENVDHN